MDAQDVDAATVKVQVIYQVFDILYLNGRSLIRLPLAERRELLRRHFEPVEDKFAFARGMDAGGEAGDGLDRIQEELERAVADNCEGLMIKTLEENASYEPSRRSLNWLKLKKDYMDGLTDTFDLVPVGAWLGKGKRTGSYGAYLLACYNQDSEEWETITKIGTGFSDEDLKSLFGYFQEEERVLENRDPMVRWNDDPRVRPDVWFRPSIVWEVKAADLSISPVHAAATGLVDPSKGIALRFPRFQRVRDDKGPDQATSSEQIAEFYQRQPVVSGTSAGIADDEFEF
jgi:DNA ligase 1